MGVVAVTAMAAATVRAMATAAADSAAQRFVMTGAPGSGKTSILRGPGGHSRSSTSRLARSTSGQH
jgi:predicted ATPase